MMRKLMKIELKSDLCAGVGKHYAAILNSDTALDEYGLPYTQIKGLYARGGRADQNSGLG